MKILLVNNEVSKEDQGWIERSVELGLGKRINQIENWTKLLKTYGEVSVVHHCDLDPAAVDADCAVLSGTFSFLEDGGLQTRYGAELELIRSAKQPIFGVCLGVQAIAAAFGVPSAFMKDGGSEYGFTEVNLLKRHPMLEDFGEKMVLFGHHSKEVSALPEGFDLLASTDACKVQLIAHRELPIVGAQLHPEIFTKDYPDGKRLIDAFFETYVK